MYEPIVLNSHDIREAGARLVGVLDFERHIVSYCGTGSSPSQRV